ncbi:coth-domain-containing protein [Piromyces finnis]|uniref:Coth-domain-containing protein n=1 Tax=Piromyces finnis TaxID=1754191 RepID=A0A1Y1V1I8_9FUNG|nr:coth-domain-containing protein [Piromyces finnis]|eukprot:ORX43928.1 coth-domain-containing protein [Piromyces finnis]
MIKFKKVLTELDLPKNVAVDPYFKQIVNNYKYNAYLNSYYEDYDDSAFDFKTKNAVMTVELNGKQNNFDKVTFSLGGQSSRYFTKPGYNIKIKNGQNLYGRRQLKLRSDVVEASYMRTKLVSDIHQRLGLTGIAANYATLYINDEYMGLFIITDSYKTSWVEFEYGEKDTTSLYKCDLLYSFLSYESSKDACFNANDEATDNSEFEEFLKTLDAAQSADDIEDIFDVDHFLYEMALEYLLGAWDHYITYGHNYFMYKPKGGKWIYLSHDFDLDLGQSMDKVVMDVIVVDLPERMNILNLDYPNYSYGDWIKHQHLTDILIFKNPQRFENILKNVVKNVFNPSVLYPHIDELKEFIRPYVKKDKTPNANGKLPGVLNEDATDYYSYEQWEANTEFTSVKEIQYFGYGIKYWILAKYRNICNTFKDLECDATFLDEYYYYPIDEEVEFPGYFGELTIPRPKPRPYQPSESTIITTTTTELIPSSTVIESTPTNNIPNDTKPKYQCFSELLGFPCCPSGVSTVYAQDEYGDWGYDFENNQWCGLTPFETSLIQEDSCWSETFGYHCCIGCQIILTDESGTWGYEENQWCGIPSYCN